MTKTENQVTTHAVLKRPAQIMAPCPQKHRSKPIHDSGCVCKVWVVIVCECLRTYCERIARYVCVCRWKYVHIIAYLYMYIMFIHNYKLFIYTHTYNIYTNNLCIYSYIYILQLYNIYIYIMYASLYARINVCTYPPEATGHAPRRHANPLHSGLLR